MTEAEWLTCADPTPMLDFLKGKASDRKFRLIACACCRHHASDVGGHDAVNFAELLADGGRVDRELQIALANLMRYPSSEVVGGAYLRYSGFVTALDMGRRYTLASVLSSLAEAAGMDANPTSTVQEGELASNESSKDKAIEGERWAQVRMLCDIVGNPFRPIPLDPTWLTPDVRILAEGIYADRVFERMPILADALQDAGCDNDDILNHCRQPGEHVRGCWVVDLVLGKK